MNVRERLPADGIYKMKSTGQLAKVIAYDEEGGTVTVKIVSGCSFSMGGHVGPCYPAHLERVDK